MQISPINSVNFRGTAENASFENCEKAINLTEKISDTFVKSDDIKTPGEIAAAVAVNTLKCFAVAAITVAGLNRLSGNRLACLFETGLKKGSDMAIDVASKLTKNNGKFKKVANFAGRTLGSIEEKLHKTYQKIATEKINGNAVHSSAKGLSRTLGLGAAGVHLIDITKRDNNNDGVKDIVQKSQSVYNKTSQECGKLRTGARALSELSELVEILS